MTKPGTQTAARRRSSPSGGGEESVEVGIPEANSYGNGRPASSKAGGPERTRLALPERRMLNAHQAAEYLGVSLSWFKRQMPVAPIKLGDMIRWDRKALDQWVDGQTKSTANMTGDEWLGVMD
ncbi:helix-turn-helix transcriptional regulator [Jiella sp. M17.18]|uniref:helix-turn-helix transcriptional regulator n=1 Tax=Jiella sp. M17.18 TaxID=3234247 RepID=UPI0034E032C2